MKDCGEYGHDKGVCGNAQCLPSKELPTMNVRVVRRELQQFIIDLAARPKHAGEWRTIGHFDDKTGLFVALAAPAVQEPMSGAEAWERVQRVLSHPLAKQRTGEQLGESILMSFGTPAAQSAAPAVPEPEDEAEALERLGGRPFPVHKPAAQSADASPTKSCPWCGLRVPEDDDCPKPSDYCHHE
jgi:hypothetical protein